MASRPTMPVGVAFTCTEAATLVTRPGDHSQEVGMSEDFKSRCKDVPGVKVHVLGELTETEPGKPATQIKHPIIESPAACFYQIEIKFAENKQYYKYISNVVHPSGHLCTAKSGAKAIQTVYLKYQKPVCFIVGQQGTQLSTRGHDCAWLCVYWRENGDKRMLCIDSHSMQDPNPKIRATVPSNVHITGKALGVTEILLIGHQTTEDHIEDDCYKKCYAAAGQVLDGLHFIVPGVEYRVFNTTHNKYIGGNKTFELL